jgi:LysM repeat protein
MSFYQPFLRRRVLVKRVASVCGMIVVLPMLGCSSPNSAYDYDRPSRDYGLTSSPAKSRPSRAVLASAGSAKAYAAAGAVTAKPDVVQSYGHVPASAPAVTASIQRTSLPPLHGAGDDARKAEGPSAGYALGAVQLERDVPPGGNGHVREAQGYGKRPYPRAESTYPGPEGPERGDYAQDNRYREEARRGGGDYVVQRGDTLYGIAEQHGLSLDELGALNDLKGDEIYPGQRLRVAGRPEPRGYEAKPYREREARPEPRGYREPAEVRGGPYREGDDEARGDYREAPQSTVPQAGVYERRNEGGPREQRYDEGERYERPRPAARAYGQ